MTTSTNKDVPIRVTESHAIHKFDRIGRPVVISDQSNNGSSSVLLNWETYVKMWGETQVKQVNSYAKDDNETN